MYSVTRLLLWFPFMQILISLYFLKSYGDLHSFIVVAKGFFEDLLLVLIYLVCFLWGLERYPASLIVFRDIRCNWNNLAVVLPSFLLTLNMFDTCQVSKSKIILQRLLISFNLRLCVCYNSRESICNSKVFDNCWGYEQNCEFHWNKFLIFQAIQK